MNGNLGLTGEKILPLPEPHTGEMKHPTPNQPRLSQVLEYAARGWAVFPVHGIKDGCCTCGKTECGSPGKHPIAAAAPEGFKDATTDEKKIRAWWSKYPRANIAIATGSVSGFFALDLDLPDGEKSLENLESKQGKLPETVEQITGSGGRHMFFKLPVGVEIRNSTSKIGPNLDIRSDGGYIVIAPSDHVSGNPYTWCPGHGPGEIEVAEAPRWLIDLVESKPNPPKRDLSNSGLILPATDTSAYGRAALEDEIQGLLATPEGGRNSGLNKSAFLLGQLVASGEIAYSDAENALIHVGERMGLTPHEVRATVKSGLHNGYENPRTPTDSIIPAAVPSKPEPPRPLVREIPPGGEYPVTALGTLMEDAVRSIVEVVQVPISLAAGSVLATASLAVQGFADVVLPIGEGRPKPVSLYMLTVAHSSDRKSTSDNYALQAVKEFEVELAEENRTKFQSYLNDKAAYERAKDLVIKNARKNVTQTRETIASNSSELSALGDEPQPPLLPFLTVGEPTIEGLAKLFLQGRPSLGLFSTEGAQMITGYGMRDDRKLATAAGLSLLWDGETLKRTRVGDGNYALPGKRLTLHLMVQPEVALKLLSDPELADQGLISRVLVAAPDSLAGTRMFRKANKLCLAVIDMFRDEIYARLKREMPLVQDSRNELKPRRLEFSEEAKAIWVAFADESERAIGPGGKYEHIKAFAGKLAEQAARLAGVITLMENLDSTEISGQAMRGACQLAEFYAGEALRLFYVGQISPDLQKAKRLLDWLHQRKESLISLPDIYQRGLNIIRDKATAQQLVKILEDHGWMVRIIEGAEIDGQYRRDVWRIIRE